jgi:hypothetical protein
MFCDPVDPLFCLEVGRSTGMDCWNGADYSNATRLISTRGADRAEHDGRRRWTRGRVVLTCSPMAWHAESTCTCKKNRRAAITSMDYSCYLLRSNAGLNISWSIDLPMDLCYVNGVYTMSAYISPIGTLFLYGWFGLLNVRDYICVPLDYNVNLPDQFKS